MYRVIVTNRAIRDLESLSKDAQLRISEAIDSLAITPVPFKSFDVKKLKGYRDTYRIRLGDLRIIYQINKDKGVVFVLGIPHRKEAYK